ncbi:MAG: hypothetical protein HN742_01410 [Lentisphaerae bacterium]|nr:hypothetical protein [Lentisphaerota bacterium]MBT5612556.1 hypothetical protein [Lentisphaerota bacterium]MBT7061351.1 hypothetical protein [Lentisphaerota bacterium]MBT7840492.1 hypothetical protein [Lentisphaerota bacterium]
MKRKAARWYRGVVLGCFACCVVAGAEAPVFTHDFGEHEGASADSSGRKVRRFAPTEEGIFHITGFFAVPPEAFIRVSAEAASDDGARLGVRCLLYDGKRKRLGACAANIWSVPLTEPLKHVSSSEPFRLPPVARLMRLTFFRTSPSGALRLGRVGVHDVPSESSQTLCEILKARLAAAGYEVVEYTGMLEARKPGERAYYHTFPGERFIPASFEKRAYIGTTWLKADRAPEFFPAGPYIYGRPEGLRVRAEKLGLTLEGFFDHLAADVKAHGGTAIYYANLTTDPPVFRMAVNAAQRRGLKVFGQLTQDLYLRVERGRDHYEKVTLPTARRIMPQYRGLEGVAGWMPKEEIPAEHMPLLREYRRELRKLDPTHALFMLHNHLAPFQAETGDLPEWFGFDRYRFRCFKAHYGLLISTPKDMASRLTAEIASCYAEAAKRGRPLLYVMQGYGHQDVCTAEEVRAWSGGGSEHLGPNTGYAEIAPGAWLGWDRYPPPLNGMHLQSWLAVAEGAKGLLIFHYGPRTLQKKLGRTLKHVTLVDDSGSETRLWREFGECMADMAPFMRLFLAWHREAVPRAATDTSEFSLHSFIRRFDAERFLLVHNRRIATWDGDSPGMPRGETELHFDETGLAGLHPAEARELAFVVEGTAPVWHLKSGRRLLPDGDGTFHLSVPAGRGEILFQGDAEALRNERQTLRFE